MFNTTVNPSNNLSGWFENSIYNLIYDNRLNEKLPRDLELVTLGIM